MGSILVSTWVLWLPLLVLFVGKLYLEHRRQARLAASGIEAIDGMDGRMFEECLAAVFRRLGYAVDLTPYAGDWGGDLVLQKGGTRTVVQAKRYNKKVGVRAVQEVVAAKARYRCAEALVVTNNFYTAQAQELARDNRVELWDRDRLVSALLQVKPQSGVTVPGGSEDMPPLTLANASPEPESTAHGLAPLQSGPAVPTCALCHKPVSDKVATYCQAKSERFGGRIYCFDHQKDIAGPRRSDFA